MPLAQDVKSVVAAMDAHVDAVIVEGGHDRDALRAAGFTRKIYTCSETSGFVSFAKRVAREHDRIAILTDFDAEGKALHHKLREHIPGSKIDGVWRKRLGTVLTEHGRRDIESINNIVDG